MRAGIYIRVSTEEQVKEGYSVSAQKQKLKSFCVSQDWDVAGLYADEGISAKDMNRPELQRMIEDIKQDKIDCVLVYRLDRLTRSVFDLYKLLEHFEKHNCKFRSATEIYDTTSAMGRMFITIVAALAQWERENMGERIAFGFAEKARQGKWPLNFAPFGYDLNKEESVLYINKHEAKVVRLIFDLYKKFGMNRVAYRLNEDKIYTKHGNKWSDNTVMKILKSYTVIGKTEWKNEIHDGLHEAIISEEQWKQTQELIKKRTTKPPRIISSNYIFSGKLKCPACNRNLVGYYTTSNYKDKSTKYYQYRCRHKIRNRCSGSKSVSERKLENAFIDYLKSVTFDDFLDNIVDQGIEKLNKKEDDIDVDGLKKELKKIEKRKKKWQYAWAEEAIEFEDFKELMDEARKQEAKTKEKLASAVEEKPESINKKEIYNALKDIEENWLVLERIEKKKLVDSIIDKIHYRHEGNKIAIDGIDFI